MPDKEPGESQAIALPHPPPQATPTKSPSTTTRQLIEQRRQRAWEFRMVRQLKLVQVAELLGVSLTQVKRDLAVMRDRNITQLAQDRQLAEALLGHAAALLAQNTLVLREAWAGLSAAPPGSLVHTRYIAELHKGTEIRLKLLQRLGLLPQTGEEAVGDVGGFDPSRFSHRQLAILRELIQVSEEYLQREHERSALTARRLSADSRGDGEAAGGPLGP